MFSSECGEWFFLNYKMDLRKLLLCLLLCLLNVYYNKVLFKKCPHKWLVIISNRLQSLQKKTTTSHTITYPIKSQYTLTYPNIFLHAQSFPWDTKIGLYSNFGPMNWNNTILVQFFHAGSTLRLCLSYHSWNKSKSSYRIGENKVLRRLLITKAKSY